MASLQLPADVESWPAQRVVEFVLAEFGDRVALWLPNCPEALVSYLDSLTKTRAMDLDLVLPGHGTPFGEPQGRIESILRTKLRRLEKIHGAEPVRQAYDELR